MIPKRVVIRVLLQIKNIMDRRPNVYCTKEHNGYARLARLWIRVMIKNTCLQLFRLQVI